MLVRTKYIPDVLAHAAGAYLRWLRLTLVRNWPPSPQNSNF